MNRYTIYCTPEQTRKALELGAPIYIFVHAKGEDRGSYKPIDEFTDAIIPTAEEMIGWLEEQGFKFNIYEKFGNSWYYYVGHRTCREPIQEFDNLKSRQEATISAIDAALEYLINNKK